MKGFFARLWRDRTAIGSLFVLMGIAACASMSINNSLIQNRIKAADNAVTVATNAIDTALLQGVISKANAQAASTVLHQVNPLLDSARSAVAANDTQGANDTLKLVNSLLQGIQTYANEAPK